MAGPALTTDAWVLLKRPPTGDFETLTVFSATEGALRVLHRVPRQPKPTHVPLDLFDEVSLWLEGAAGGGWFVKEVRVRERHTQIGRRYETLQQASSLAQVVTQNPVPEESRAAVHQLLRTAFTAFEQTERPDIVFFKSLYCFARDEGHPLKQQWVPTLPSEDRQDVATLLNRPVAELDVPRTRVRHLQRRLEEYLRGHTELVVPNLA